MIAIVFDVDGVLIHGYHAKPEFRKYWDKDLEADFGIKRGDFRNKFIKGPFEKDVLTGRKDLYKTLKEVLPQIGYNDDPQILIDYWMEKDSNVHQELMKYIEILSKCYDVELYIATNQEHIRAHYLMHQVGFNRYFKDIFYAARLGVLKPAFRFFEEVEQLLPASKSDIILFDDNQGVVDGAIKCGWEAHQFDVPQDLLKSSRVQSLLTS